MRIYSQDSHTALYSQLENYVMQYVQTYLINRNLTQQGREAVARKYVETIKLGFGVYPFKTNK